jgi:hypothetical protein
MHISFSPQRRSDALSVSKAGDVLTINGEAFDFSAIPEGAVLPASAVACDFVIGEISRIEGTLHLTLILPHGPDPSPEVSNPAALSEPPDGPLSIPFDVVVIDVLAEDEIEETADE